VNLVIHLRPFARCELEFVLTHQLFPISVTKVLKQQLEQVQRVPTEPFPTNHDVISLTRDD